MTALAGITRDYRAGAAQRHGFERAISVIARHDPGVSDAFARTSAIVLNDVMASGRQDLAWSAGRLNRNGGPLEFAFSTMSNDLRYTVEVGGAETPPGRRLLRAVSLLEELGVDPHWGGSPRRFRQLQHDAPLAFGAWLGVRHLRITSGRPETAFKIYAEVPAETTPGAASLVTDYLGGPVLPDCEARLVLVGGAPESDRCELYFELSQRKPSAKMLAGLLARVGLAARLDDIMTLVRSFHFREAGEADTLPEASYGISYAVQPGGRNPVFSIFVLPSALAGGDGYLRREILTASLGRGWNLGCYAALTQPLADRFFKSGFHNMLTFSVGAESAPGFQVSISPPPEVIHDH